jgi:two-component system chemotaxis response regulator CheB
MRVLVIDDSAFIRKSIAQMLATDRAFIVVGEAKDGREGVELAKALKPDLIVLDVEMPVVDGLAALGHIRATCHEPRPAVLMCSTKTVAGGDLTLAALRLGASDFITKDVAEAMLGAVPFREELLGKLKAIGQHALSLRAPSFGAAVPRFTQGLRDRAIDLVVIGASTGGPPIVEHILSALPKGFSAAVVVAQHMPFIFTQSLARALSARCALPVSLGEHGAALRPGAIVIAPGGLHTRIRKTTTSAGRDHAPFFLDISEHPIASPYRPSVNELFASAASAAGAHALGVMLSGMGDDGLVGARFLHAAGGTLLAQTAETCVVYGMPKVVVDAKLVAAVLSPERLTRVITEACANRSARAA